MKEKIKRISSSTWALLLALMMVVSSFSVLAATTNVEKTGTISYWVLRGDFNSWSTDTQYQFGGADGGSITYDLSSKKGSTIQFRTDAYENGKIHFNSSKGTVTDNTEVQLKWGTGDVMYYTVPSDSNGEITFKVTVRDGNNYLTVTAGSGGSTTTDLYLCGYINNSDVGHGDNHYKLTQSDDKYSGTFEFDSTSNTQFVTISNGSMAYVAKRDNAASGTEADSKSPTSESPNPNFKWMVDTSTSKTITFTWDDTNKTLSWVTGSVEPTETTPTETTTTTPTPSKNYYICGSLVNSSWSTDYKDSPFIWSDTDNFYISKTSFKKPTSDTYFRIHDGATIYGPNSTKNDIPVKSTKEAELKEKSDTYAFLISPQYITSDYYLCTDGKYVWYKVAQPNVAKSVNLTANPENVVVGGSTTLTANVTELNIGASNVKYTFQEVDENGNAVGSAKEETTSTTTFDNLTEGKHYYKVTVSADGYTSVTATVVVNVNQAYNVTAKYKITEDGITYTDKDSDVNIVSVNGEVTSNTSSGTVVAKNTITIGSSTYVFAGWRSDNGSFTDATKASTTFSPSADADVYAKYKKQYTVSASTTGGNGTINVEKTTYLAGDTVTININPNSGYQLKSLMRTTGTSGETTDVKAGVSNNKYVVKNISSDETFVAEFENNPLDYSKYRLGGHFDNSQKWTYASGIEFDKNGKATFTVTNTSSGSGQFLIYDSSGVAYGSNVQKGQVVDYTTTYTTTKGNGYVYYVQYAGTYVVEIVDIDSNGVPKFKVTKDDTISKYQLYISTGKSQVGKLLGNFTKAKDGTTYQYIITVDAGTHYFYIKDSTSTDSTLQYSDGRDNCELGTSYLMNRRNNVENIQYKLSAGSYKVTYGDFNTYGEGKFKIDSLSKPLAESVTLSSSATAVKIGNKVTLTAQINNNNVEKGATYTYTFYDGEGKEVGKKVTTELTASCETTSNTKGVVSYKVVVSTNATYIDPDYPTVNLTYTDISSDTIQVDYREKILYIAKVNNDGTLGKLYPLTADSFKPADGVQSVTIAVFSDKTISDDTVCNLTVSESKNKYTTITSSTIDTDDVAGIPTYTINCNEGASSPTIYIVDDNIYAVATFDMGATNTFNSSNTVDYYFAEPTENTNISNPTTGDGLRIYYWNNSVATQCGYADVTTKVDKDGKASGSNKITVNMDDLYSSGATGPKTFNVYKVSLPVWATSFKFVSSGETTLYTKNTFVSNDPNGNKGDASIGLNPNRIYLLYQKGAYYSRGVVLDSSFWTETSRENNNVPTKNFKANAVNYNTQYDEGGNVTNKFNTYLNALYNTAYANPLFFGYVKPDTTEVAGNQNFRIQDNLAMRWDDNHAYYASVQGLAGNTLSSTSKNENGCGYLLTADGSSNMPLFDYKKLKSNSNVASNVYEGLNFPFNESTFNGITTYSYDSFTDKNRVIVGDDFKVDTYSNATVGNDKGVGFFPFNNSDSTKNANKYGYGTEFDIDFYMSETGKLTDADGKGKDITFNFSGDDDVWVYVDGVLVLDLGGAHKVSSGSINFSDMKVIYKAAVDTSDNISARGKGTADTYATKEKYVTTVDLAKIFKANGAEFNNKNSSKKHTLQMFYMERGSFDSNCSISFNLPQNTGLLVRNDVNFDSVNPGLKDATMGIANKDYFSYMIENKYASDAEFTKLTGKYGTLPNKTTSNILNNNGNFTFGTSNPLYPIVTTDNIIRRVVSGTTYYLAVKNDSGNSCNSYWSTLLENAYKGLPSINFSLPDDFAKLENSTDENNSTAVSGQTDTNGGFNLLFNQSAKFNSKIPSNTMVKVVQNETLYEVNAGDSNTAMSVASNDKGKVTRRNVSNFYSTSYKITDDKSQKVITEAKGNKDSNVFSKDTFAGTDGFYFADYSENHSDSSAMTVNFTNTVSTSDIKIIKKVSSTENSDDRVEPKSGDRFTFTVKLSNIFGDKDDTMLNEYKNLTYKVYDSAGNLEGTRTYGTSGVSITANEYAVITGIPVGTHYEVTEKQRTGYQFDNVTGEFVATTLNSTKAGTQTNGIKDTDFIPCKDSVDSTISKEVETVTGNMPIANDPNNAGKTVQLTYTNKEAGFTISFKYYDREVTTGTVAHINTKPTVVNYVFSVADLAEYQNQDGTYDYVSMITKAVTASGINPGNVIDSYKYFTSQSAAETGIQNEYSYRNYDETNSKYQTYGEAYTNGNFANHTDCYGRLQDSESNDGEDWVSYYNGKTKYKTEDDAKKADASVTSITVWFFNNLKSYSPTFHYATAKNELSSIDGTSKFVGTQLNIIKPVFYNVRLGVANGVDSIDEEGFYLKEYGVTGYTGTYSGTAMSIQNGEKELKFLYWSYDNAGKSIASNSYKYGYRVTNNIHLYAIYGEAKDNTEPGLTVSMNNPDYHTDSNGINRVRLNTVMNVYNCPDDDPNIKNVAVIYILDPNNYIQSYINENNTTALKNIRTSVYNLIHENGSKAQFSGVTIKIDGKNDNKAFGLTYTASKDLLTNKNRVQFTTDFKQSALASQKIIYTFSAMNYYKESATEESKTDWIVSDNCIKYIFDANGKVTGDSTQVNCLQ